jgi:hypothetical protein
LEKKTISKWIKLFKTLGIYDEDYHEKYRHEIHNKRYKTYINLVFGDIQEKINLIKESQIKEYFKNFNGWKYIFKMP